MADPTPNPDPAPAPAPAPEPAARPENIPETFWDATAGSVKTDDLIKSWSELNSKVNPPEPTAEQKAEAEKLAGEQALAARKELSESYEFKAPEGLELNPEQLAPVKELFAELGVPKDGAQKLIDLYAANALAIDKAVDARNEQAWKDLHTAWQGEIEKLPDFGGAKLPETKASITKVMDQLGSPELRAALDLTGADKNPHVFKFLAKVSQALTEGRYFEGKPTGGEAKSLAERMYPNGGNQQIGGQPPRTENN